MSAPTTDTGAVAVRQALNLLGRASADWRNGGSCESGSLHWPVAISLARRELRQALETMEGASTATLASDSAGCSCGREHCSGDRLDSLGWESDDARAGLAWYNSATVTERRYWHQVAHSAVPADAWEAYKTGAPQP